MKQNKISAKVFSYAKSAIAGAVLPVFLIYIMIDKPDYKIANGLAHIVIPVANWTGDIISAPVRIIGKTVVNIRELTNLRSENEELRARLDAIGAKNTEFDVAILENQKLARELDIVRSFPIKSIVANIRYINNAAHHNNFFINKGTDSGIKNGMVVISFTGDLVGIISDAGTDFARVRALSDAKSNIPVRIAGTQVYGFLKGNGSKNPSIGFFSDPEFQATPGLRLITSSISGVAPDGIMVGNMKNSTDATIRQITTISTVMVLEFTNSDKYK